MMIELMRVVFAFAAVLALVLAGCGGAGPPPTGPQPTGSQPMKLDGSLFERLGGEPAIAAVVDAFVANIADDNTIGPFFRNADVPEMKRLLREQFCAVAGGPCTYTGKDMKTAHVGMGISNADFDALAKVLEKSLAQVGIDPRERTELLALLGSMRPDIVSR